eukprot:9490634-Pyramimonas_sp.AAC.1
MGPKGQRAGAERREPGAVFVACARNWNDRSAILHIVLQHKLHWVSQGKWVIAGARIILAYANAARLGGIDPELPSSQEGPLTVVKHQTWAVRRKPLRTNILDFPVHVYRAPDTLQYQRVDIPGDRWTTKKLGGPRCRHSARVRLGAELAGARRHYLTSRHHRAKLYDVHRRATSHHREMDNEYREILVGILTGRLCNRCAHTTVECTRGNRLLV